MEAKIKKNGLVNKSSHQKLKRNEDLFLDEIIQRLWDWKYSSRRDTIPAIKTEEILKLCELAVKLFKKEPSLIKIRKKDLPLTICADLHGQLFDLKIILKECQKSHQQNWLFLGDYVDRGKYGVELICFLLAYKTRYPNKYHMLRGNHEDYNTTMIYGFYDECLEKYGDNDKHKVWHSFINVFNHMPLAALIDNRILAMHGGISPFINNLDDIKKIKRPTMIPMYGLICDLLWSDPGSLHPGWATSHRFISFIYDHTIIQQFCDKHKIDLIVRGHQIADEWRNRGYKFEPENSRLVTVFSAPNYQGCGNTGTVLKISETKREKYINVKKEKIVILKG